MRQHDQPGARYLGGRGPLHRVPDDSVAPGVHRPPTRILPVPPGERRHCGLQFCRDAEGLGQRGEVLLLDGCPERLIAAGVPVAPGRPSGREPVGLVLEGIGGKPDGPGLGDDGRPVDGGAMGVGVAERLEDGVGFGPSLAAGGRGGVGVGEGGGEGGVGADLDKDMGARNRPDGLGEVHGVAGVVDPVVGSVDGVGTVGRWVQGEVGGRKVSWSSAARNSSSMESMRGEWKAWLTLRRATRMSR